MLPPALRRPLHRARSHAIAAVLAAAAVATSCVLITAPASARPGDGLSTVRIVAAPRAVHAGGHRWRPDRAFATGGHLVRSSSHSRTRPGLFTHVRRGAVGYRLRVRPGVYRVQVDVLATARRHRLTVTANGRVLHPRLRTMRHAHSSLRAWWAAFDIASRESVIAVRVPTRGAIRGVAALSVTGTRPLPRVHRRPSARPTPTPASTPTPISTPTPTTTTPPTSTPPTTPAPSAATVTPEDFGAVGDGRTDDTAALQTAFDDAAGRTIVLPAGHVYAHSGVLHLRVAGLHLTGPGELLATQESTSSVWVEADDVTLDGGLTIATATTTQRWSAWEQMGVRLTDHKDTTLRDVTVSGSAAAGVYVGGAQDFTLDHVTVRNTRADGIHMTEGAADGTVIAPTVVNSGDDGVAVVSYQQDGTPCHDITITSPTVLGTSGGRGLSVIGGVNVTETDIDVESTSAAAVYVGAEGSPWNTAAAAHVLISGGKIVNANTDVNTDHGAVVVLSGESNVVPTDITIASLAIAGTRSTASRDLGVITYGTPPTGVLFRDITIRGGPGSAYSGNTPQSSYALRDIVQNGTRLPDQG